MITFRIARDLRGDPMVEVWRDGEFVAAIYSHDNGVRIVSKYLDSGCHEPEVPMSLIVNLSKVR